MILSLLFLSLNLSSLFRCSIARGGTLHRSDRSGYLDGSIYGHLGRRLYSENNQMSEEEYIEKLEKLAEGYMSNSDLEKAMKEFNSRCSNISRIYSIGKSVLGVPLWAVEISDLPGAKEAEPAFKFIGNVHGDEPLGRELLLLLANWLCDNYMKDPLATLIVDGVHLHILPSMNPDGFSLRRRGNANNIDLNRDFPDQFFRVNDDMDLRQPETKAIMKWLEDVDFTASASLHGIPTLWGYNRMSMLSLVAGLVKTGLHGRIFSSDNGRPLPASVAIRGINYTIAASKTLADYHRLLAPGKYEVIASMPGYRSKSACVVLGEGAVKVDFVLDPETSYNARPVFKSSTFCQLPNWKFLCY
ncbi:UNVERIFIED_CONTAM: Carboxypeptidase SOL1 [Sesamum indicum]